MSDPRLQGFKEAVANIASSASPFNNEYIFYMHLLAKCKVVLREDLPAAAGVAFNITHYILYLNPTEVIAEHKNEQGVTEQVLGFSAAMPLEHRIGILKHEMLHIALGHLTARFQEEEINHKQANIAMDCALNQDINREHLPSYAVYPNNFPPVKVKVERSRPAEYYYQLLQDEYPPIEPQQGGSGGQGSSESTQQGESPLDKMPALDDHSVWDESEGDEDLQKEITKRMVEEAADQTIKSRGSLPVNYSQMIENLTVNREVDWKQVLRRIVGNKKANSRKTLMRKNRRLPHAAWVKGITKDRVHHLAVVSDVSGSVSGAELKTLWGTILDICNTFNTAVTLIQVDTKPSEPEALTANASVIERKACGGTTLHPALETLKEYNVQYDAVVVTTDNYLCPSDVREFKNCRVPVVWLVSPTGQDAFPEQITGKHKYIRLTDLKT